MEPCQITLMGADAAAAGVSDGGTVDRECVRGRKCLIHPGLETHAYKNIVTGLVVELKSIPPRH